MKTIKKFEVFKGSLDEFGTPMQDGGFKGYLTVVKVEDVLKLIEKYEDCEGIDWNNLIKLKKEIEGKWTQTQKNKKN